MAAKRRTKKAVPQPAPEGDGGCIELGGRAYTRHPASALYTSLGVDPEALKASIEEQGQLEPIVLDGSGAVVDGWQRLTACHALGIEPMTATLPEGAEPYRYAAARNVSRRQLTRAQRARVAWRYLAEKGLGMKDAEAARLLRVTKAEMACWRDVERVAAELDAADGAALTARVEEGSWPLATAGKACRLALGKRRISMWGRPGDLKPTVLKGFADADEAQASEALGEIVETIRRDEEAQARRAAFDADRKKLADHAKRIGASKAVYHEMIGLRAAAISKQMKKAGKDAKVPGDVHYSWGDYYDSFEALHNHYPIVREAAAQLLKGTKADLADEVAAAKTARAERKAAEKAKEEKEEADAAKRDEQYEAQRAEAAAKAAAYNALSDEEREAVDAADAREAAREQAEYFAGQFVKHAGNALAEQEAFDEPDMELDNACSCAKRWLKARKEAAKE